MNDSINTVVSSCFSIALSDDPWQDIGFSKRPKHGFFIKRFRPTWRNNLEKRVLQEIVIGTTSAYILARVITQNDIDLVVTQYTSEESVVHAMGYSSVKEASDQMTISIQQYIETNPKNWSAVLFNRLNVESIPDKKMRANLMLGCVNFAQNLCGMVEVLKKHT